MYSERVAEGPKVHKCIMQRNGKQMRNEHLVEFAYDVNRWLAD